MSIAFENQPFTFTQPDGAKLQVLGTGNQHQATFTTLDGYTVVQDPLTGFYQYAQPGDEHPQATGILPGALTPEAVGLPAEVRPPPSPEGLTPFVSPGLPRSPSRWQVRRQQHRERVLLEAANGIAMAPPQRETVGDFVGLCLLIQFPDVPGPIPQTEIDAFCNKPGYNGFGNNGSVRDYFHDQSDGKLTYTNVVAPWYTAKKPRSYYTNESVAQPIRARELILEALAHHKAQGFDFTGLSADEMAYVYAVNVFYAGARENNWSKGLWPHSYHLQAPVQLAPGKLAHDYQITDLPPVVTLGTFCHENGHMICDFPDLYDYGYQSKGVGHYCLMCAGGSDPRNPTGVGAYLKYAAGWSSNVIDALPGASITLPAGRNEFALLRKPNNRTQYFIIENRAKAGRDVTLPDAGLAIWKVDELGSNNNEAMTSASHYECSLIQADNRFDMERGVNNGDVGDLYAAGPQEFGPKSKPNSKWWDGSKSGLHVRGINGPGATLTFTA